MKELFLGKENVPTLATCSHSRTQLTCLVEYCGRSQHAMFLLKVKGIPSLIKEVS